MELEIKNNNKGFTLVELLVSLLIFSSLVVTMSGIAVSMIKAQRKGFALQNTQEASRYILEVMTKEIRMSVVNTGAGSGLTTLNITNSKGDTFNYQFDNGNERIYRDGSVMSPSNLEVTGNFYVRKSDSPVRVVVTIVMQVKSRDANKVEQQAEIYLQSSVAARAF